VPNIEDTPLGTLPGAGTVGRLAGLAQRVLPGGDSRPGRTRLVAPKTSFNGRITPHRRFVFGQLPLDEVKAVKNEHGVTVNDVVVSICAGAVRRWLLAHDELPDSELVAQIPVSVRTSEQVGTYGNRIMLMSAPLFTNEPEPIRRLQRKLMRLPRNLKGQAVAELNFRLKALPGNLQAPKGPMPKTGRMPKPPRPRFR